MREFLKDVWMARRVRKAAPITPENITGREGPGAARSASHLGRRPQGLVLRAP